MPYVATFRPAYLLFFFIRQPIGAGLLYSGFLFWQFDRIYDWGLKSSFRDLRQSILGFPTDEGRWLNFKKIDREKRNEMVLKN
ncbi:hypothetical protein PACTADRAFT_47439 [Pachysolen tannophilus NRRL Y-2460]|uniref:Uncharacterized protein n=1 Tax=Pachysolen tannophilus NRRL Y-2460 TaxID=669874 RepID=A0A1E4U0M2_PACTA|nr:hypothetical protein PACTADRAFT_47439 [Pachysolen tannophilus NRRL Y-2460]